MAASSYNGTSATAASGNARLSQSSVKHISYCWDRLSLITSLSCNAHQGHIYADDICTSKQAIRMHTDLFIWQCYQLPFIALVLLNGTCIMLLLYCTILQIKNVLNIIACLCAYLSLTVRDHQIMCMQLCDISTIHRAAALSKNLLPHFMQ